ncbi:MAG: hypothetical protein HY257_10785 [Chloroflexi bacterium]|nr:hypothetical protein [Chloroflexota bacterium]
MFGSIIIDVAVGVAFVFLLLSVVASHINDLVARFMDWRSKDLDKHIRQMLSDPNLANKVLNHPLVAGLASKPGRTPSYIPSNTFALTVFDALVPASGNQTVVENVRAQVSGLPDSRMKEVVLPMLVKAEGNLEQARKDFAGWYDESMERLSGAFKRRMMLLSLIVAALITLLFGVDAIDLANNLYKEPGVRAALAGAAQTASKDTTTFNEAVKQIQGGGLAIGWSTLPTDAAGWLKKIAGLLMTTIAVSLGAPFWFDLLRNISSLRGGGSAQATSAEPKK